MPELVQQFRLHFLQVEIELVHERLEAGMLSDEIDVALLHPLLKHGEFAQLEFPPEDLVLALPASSELSLLDAIPVSRLAREPFLINPRRMGPYLYGQIIHLCRTDGGSSPMIVQEVTGVGCGFVIRSFEIIRHPGVVYRPLAGSAVFFILENSPSLLYMMRDV